MLHPAERLQARLDDPTNRWTFNRADLAERDRWNDPTAAGRIVIETLEEMDPRHPAQAEDLDGIVVT